MSNNRNKLIRELEEDGFCEKNSTKIVTVLNKNFVYSRPPFCDSVRYSISVAMMEYAFTIKTNQY